MTRRIQSARRRHRRMLPIWATVLLGLAVALAGTQASAHAKTWQGSILWGFAAPGAVGLSPTHETVDWGLFWATCEDHEDSYFVSFLDVTAYRGHKMAFRFLGGGGVSATGAEMELRLESEPCGSPAALTNDGVRGICPSIRTGRVCNFTMPSFATTLAIWMRASGALAGAGALAADSFRWSLTARH